MVYWLEILKRSNSVGIILVLSVLITFMGLLSPIFIIHIFNRYITFGLEGTLYFLIIGALLVASFEFFFRNLRNQIFEQVIKWPIKSAKLEIFNRSFDLPGLSKQKIIDVLDLNNNVPEIFILSKSIKYNRFIFFDFHFNFSFFLKF
jgi:ABC-type bacteriocin/lantibiotic exporter with double-glycine peptidase domain